MVGMGVALVVGFVMIVVAATRVPSTGAPSVLPTAVAGIAKKDGEYATPVTNKKPLARGPTSTPAPFATKLPPTPLPPPKGIPHDLKGRDDCLYCHKGNTYFAVPVSHARRTNQMCRGCHSLSSSAPQPAPRPMPHSATDREGCLMCHLRGDNGAHPMPGDHAGRMNDTCRSCHRSK